MDQTATNIQTILALDLVVIAFAMIPGLKNAFDAFIAKIHQLTPERTIDDVYQEIKTKFYEKICEVMMEKFKLMEDLKQLDPKYYVMPKDIIFHSHYWFDTFNTMYYEISDKLDENHKYDYLDKSHVSFKVELDEKEEKRVSYERKKKNEHNHNKRRNTK